jgi:hypothetical protein
MLLTGSTWRLTGARGAGRSLVAVAADDGADEADHAIASMLLVRGGDRAVGLIEEAVATGQVSLGLVDVLASIDTERAAEVLNRLASDPAVPADVATAARRALRFPGADPGA